MMESDLAFAASTVVSVESAKTAGSGAPICLGQRRGLILSCWHVVDNAEDLHIVYRVHDRGYKFKREKAHVIAQDPSNDLVLLGVELDSLPSFAIATGEPDLQEQVCVAGNPNELFGVAVEARLQGKRGSFRRKSPRYLISAQGIIVSGISGGPVLNAQGSLVGIIDAGPQDQEIPIHGFGYAIPLHIIKKFLKKVEMAAGAVREERSHEKEIRKS